MEITRANIQDKILETRGESVILDRDVAELYGVNTRDINKSVKNNPEKFPDGYVLNITEQEVRDLRWKNSTANFAKTRFLPKAFTEKGLYMLATVLRSPRATQTTLNIIETFSRIRQLSSNIQELTNMKDEDEKRSLLQRSSELISGILEDDLALDEKETILEVNLAVLKLKHTIKRKKEQS